MKVNTPAAVVDANPRTKRIKDLQGQIHRRLENTRRSRRKKRDRKYCKKTKKTKKTAKRTEKNLKEMKQGSLVPMDSNEDKYL